MVSGHSGFDHGGAPENPFVRIYRTVAAWIDYHRGQRRRFGVG
jgi:hypothetical protein